MVAAMSVGAAAARAAGLKPARARRPNAGATGRLAGFDPGELCMGLGFGFDGHTSVIAMHVPPLAWAKGLETLTFRRSSTVRWDGSGHLPHHGWGKCPNAANLLKRPAARAIAGAR
jgi:hypothetical protein